MIFLTVSILFVATVIPEVKGELCRNATDCYAQDATRHTHCDGAGWAVVCSSKNTCTCSKASQNITSLSCTAQSDCEGSAAQMKCAGAGWSVGCTGARECTCLLEFSCSTNTDCGPGIKTHCPFHGRWGCHTVGLNRRCSCLFG